MAAFFGARFLRLTPNPYASLRRARPAGRQLARTAFLLGPSEIARAFAQLLKPPSVLWRPGVPFLELTIVHNELLEIGTVELDAPANAEVCEDLLEHPGSRTARTFSNTSRHFGWSLESYSASAAERPIVAAIVRMQTLRLLRNAAGMFRTDELLPPQTMVRKVAKIWKNRQETKLLGGYGTYMMFKTWSLG